MKKKVLKNLKKDIKEEKVELKRNKESIKENKNLSRYIKKTKPLKKKINRNEVLKKMKKDFVESDFTHCSLCGSLMYKKEDSDNCALCDLQQFIEEEISDPFFEEHGVDLLTVGQPFFLMGIKKIK
jgi:rubrerythrin